jgi:hypothetical protein
MVNDNIKHFFGIDNNAILQNVEEFKEKVETTCIFYREDLEEKTLEGLCPGKLNEIARTRVPPDYRTKNTYDVLLIKNADKQGPDGFVAITINGNKIIIELICARSESKVGKTLLQFLTYRSIKSGIPLILEVQGGYNNPVAMCVYQKVGFVIDPRLIHRAFNFNMDKIVMHFNPLREFQKHDYVIEPFCRLKDQNQIDAGIIRKIDYYVNVLPYAKIGNQKIFKELQKYMETLTFDTIVKYLDLSPEKILPIIQFMYDTQIGPEISPQKKNKDLSEKFLNLYQQQRHAGGGTTRRHKKYNRITRRLH